MKIVDQLNCESCGGALKITGEPIITCPYCGSTYNVKENEIFIVKHSIIENKLDKDKAIEIAKGWLSDSLMGPSDISSSKITGAELMFVPVWVFKTTMKGQSEGIKTRTGTKESVTKKINKDSYEKVLARRDTSFDIKNYHTPMEVKTTFDINMVANAKVLNGEIDEEEARELVKQQVVDSEKYLLSESMDEITNWDVVVEAKDAEFLHIPLWSVTYNYKGSNYPLIIDGSKGEIVKSEIPPPQFISTSIIAAVVVSIIIILLLIFLLIK